MTEFVTHNIRTVLKTYQNSATNSLQGPGQSLPTQNPTSSLATIIKKEPLSSPEPNDTVDPPPIPLRPPEIPQPILTAPDPGRGELYQTELEGKPIGCFLLGGEMRLCLPQFLNNVLNDFSLDQINRIFDELRIFCSQCTPGQLMEFKAAKILPDDVKASGLITRTNAERLCSALLHRPEMRASNMDIPKGAISFKIYHRCFGKCEGICTPELYTTYLNPACIMCMECNSMFTPQKFVGHVHRQKENRTCHWGFDSRNWRDYMHVAFDADNRDKYAKMLDEMRDLEQQERRDACLKRKVCDEDCPQAEMMEDPLTVILPTSCKRDSLLDIPSKKSKMIDETYLLEYQRYQALLYAQAHYAQQEQLSAFRPWTPKPPLLHLPYSPVAAAAAVAAAANLPYLSQEPPVLQNPERVVRHTESERFERTFQPNVALAPRKSILSKEREREREREKERERDREREREREKERTNAAISNFTETEIHIKQERPSTPDIIAQSPDEMRLVSPTSDIGHHTHRLHQQRSVQRLPHQQSPHSQCTTTSISSANHQQQQSNGTAAPVSPEEFSGSNEITSSTSPVPNALNANSASTTPTPTVQHHKHQDQQALMLTTINQNHPKTADNNSMIVCVPSRIHHINNNLSNTRVRSPTPPSIREQYKLVNNLSATKQHFQQRSVLQNQQQSPPQSTTASSSSSSTKTLSSSNILVSGVNSGNIGVDGVVVKNMSNGVSLGSNPEFELSTDTDDDSMTGEPDSSNIPPGPWEITTDALKDTRPSDRDKILHIIRTLISENAQLRHCGVENARLLAELRIRDEQIAELRQELYHRLMLASTATTTKTVDDRRSPTPNTLNAEPASMGSVITKAESCCPVSHNDVTITPAYNYSQPLKRIKSETEPIKVPLKKSSRRSPEDTVVVLNHSHRDDSIGETKLHHESSSNKTPTTTSMATSSNTTINSSNNESQSPASQQASPTTTTPTPIASSSTSSASSSSSSSSSSSETGEYDSPTGKSHSKQKQMPKQPQQSLHQSNGASIKCD